MDLPKIRLLVLNCLLTVFLLSTLTFAQDINAITELEAFLDGVFAIQMKQYHVPGVAVAVINPDGILISKGYGYADLEKSIPMDPASSLHRTGSNSKILVWTAVLQLVEQGKLDLYSDINDYLDFDIGQGVQPITLHHLLTHTSGFEEVVSQTMVTKAEEVKPLEQYLRAHLPGRVFTPGAVVAYSNYGTALAAYIVERVTNQPFDAYVQEHILVPLEMTMSTFAQPVPPELLSDLAQGYAYKHGTYTAANFEYVQSYPAGALSSTVDEMANLIQTLLNLGEFGDKRILEQDTALLMQTQQFTSHPNLPGVTYGLLEADYNGYRVLSHGGDTFFFHTGLYFLPTEQIGVYVTYNSADSTLARIDFFKAFMDRYYPPQEQAVVPSPLPLGSADNYRGVFHHARSNSTKPEAWLRFLQTVSLRVDQEGYLVLEAGGQQTRYGTISPGLFQEVGGKDLLAVSYKGNQAQQIHFAGPDTFLRTPWYETPIFIGSLLLGAVLIMLFILIGWIKQLLKPKLQTPSLALPKILGLVVILLSFTILVVFVDAVLDFHPNVMVPLMLLETTSTLKTISVLTKVLVVLGGFQLLANSYLWITRKGNLWQRVYFTLLTLSVAVLLWILWQVNFF